MSDNASVSHVISIDNLPLSFCEEVDPNDENSLRILRSALLHEFMRQRPDVPERLAKMVVIELSGNLAKELKSEHDGPYLRMGRVMVTTKLTYTEEGLESIPGHLQDEKFDPSWRPGSTVQEKILKGAFDKLSSGDDPEGAAPFENHKEDGVIGLMFDTGDPDGFEHMVEKLAADGVPTTHVREIIGNMAESLRHDFPDCQALEKYQEVDTRLRLMEEKSSLKDYRGADDVLDDARKRGSIVIPAPTGRRRLQ